MFGTPSPSPFGAPNSSPFGATTSTPAFGAAPQSNPFGASTPGGMFGAKPFGSATPSTPFGQTPFGGGTATGVFGQTQPAFGATTPAFGAPSTPAFGSTTTPTFGAFGQQQQQQQKPAFGFGATPSTNPFGGAAFGQTPQTGFGGTPAFGASSTPAFGQQSTPAFGAASTPAFGAGSSVFGASSTPAFGQTATPAFGSSTPAFGASSAPAFGSSTPAFGAPSTPAFGSTATPAFGATAASPFGGSPGFGASTPAFGSTTPGFGATTFGAQKPGSRAAPYAVTNDVDSSSAAGSQPSKFTSISAMPQFRNKSAEELRWEDYQQNDKGGPNPAGQQPAAGGLFGSSPQSSPFGTSTSVFGGAGSPSPFGAASSSPFGQTTSIPAFGQPSAPAFGAASTPAFGAAAPSPFGQSFGGAASTPAFGAPSAPAFGASSTPALGGGGLFGSTTPAFGQSAPAFGGGAFGAASQASPFGATTGAFGQASTPAFGQQSSSTFGGSSLFGSTTGSAFGGGAFGASSSPGFGTSTPAFGQASTPAFGGSLFGQTGAQSTLGSAFGTKPAGLTMSTPGTSPGLFGGFGQPSAPAQGSAFSFGGGSSLFPQTQPAGGGLFGGSTFGGGFGAASTPGFGGMQAGAQPSMQPNQQLQPQPVVNPFGTLPAMPQMTIQRSAPAVQYGISTLPVSDKAPITARTSTTLTPRHLTPRSKVKLHSRRLQPRRDAPGKVSFFSDAVGEATPSPKADVLFMPREKPRALFIREVETEPFAGMPVGSGIRGTPARSMDTAASPQDEGHIRVEATPTPARFLDRGQPDTTSPENQAGLQQAGGVPHANGPLSNLGSATPPSGVKEKRTEAQRADGYVNGMTANGHTLSGHRPVEAAIVYEHGADIEAILPKLRNVEQGYYTEPNIGELAAKERAEAGYIRRVKNFKVGRRNFGWVRWDGETDVRRLDLQDIVQLNKAEVVVYPDESKKPDVGKGLNKPAEVALFNIRCIDKETGKAVTEGPAAAKFEEKLRKRVEKQGAHFVSYDAVSGEWRFRVEHFSRYGLIDSDEEDEDILEAAAAGRRRLDQAGDAVDEDDAELAGMEVVPLGDRTEDLAEEGEEGIDGQEGMPQRVALAHSLPAQLGLDPRKMQQMKQSLFALDGEEQAEDDSSQQFPARASVLENDSSRPWKVGRVARAPAVWHQKGLAVASSRKARTGGNLLWPSPILRRMPHSITSPAEPPVLHGSPLLAGETAVAPVPKRPRKEVVGFAEDGASGALGNANCSTDAGLFLGRSFRVGWGPGGVLVHAGTPVRGDMQGQKSSQVVLEKVALAPSAGAGGESENQQKEALAAPLQKVLEWEESAGDADVPHEASGCPARRVLRCEREQLKYLCQDYLEVLGADTQEAGSNEGRQLLLRHQEMVWELVDILFSEDSGMSGSPLEGGTGPEANDEMVLSDEENEEVAVAEMAVELPVDAVTKELKRRGQFVSWLQKHMSRSVEKDLQEENRSYLSRIFAYLCWRKLEEAVAVALAAGDIRLAMLLAQGGTRVSGRADVSAQLAAWERSGVVIEEERLQLYTLLAGHVEKVTSNKKLDWKRYLGLLICYGSSPDQPLQTGFKAYKELIGTSGQIPPPIPLYIEEGAVATPTRAPFDTLFYLLLLYAGEPVDEASLRTMLRTASASPDWLDNRLAWHLLQVLEAVGAVGVSGEEEQQGADSQGWGLHELHMGYAAQLAAAGLPEWAVFVALHLPGKEFREAAVKELLGLYCRNWCHDEEKRDFLQNVLKVPSSWLRAAEAVDARYRGDAEAELQALLDSQQWQAAHVIFVTSRAPLLFMAGKHSDVKAGCDKLAVHSGEIENWRYGGQLYLDFYAVEEAMINPQAQDVGLEGLEQRMDACKSLFARLEEAPSLWKNEDTQILRRLVETKMADRLSGLLSEAGAVDGVAPTQAVAAGAMSISLLAPLPENLRMCRVQEAATNFSKRLQPVLS